MVRNIQLSENSVKMVHGPALNSLVGGARSSF